MELPQVDAVPLHQPRPTRPGRAACLQGFRIAILTAILALIHHQHQLRQQDVSPENILADVTLEAIQAIFPQAERVGELVQRQREVLGPKGELLGYVLQTSPDGDRHIGFSGPTNVLIGLDPAGKIRDIHILTSGDTKEHVAQVAADLPFRQGFQGLHREQVSRLETIDAVSGATLTSLAIAQAIMERLGGSFPSLKFPNQITLKQVRMLFPQAERVGSRGQSSLQRPVWDKAGKRLGTLLSTSPAADNLIGYQGPTRTLVGFDSQGKFVGAVIADSYDNEPYVGYLREEPGFLAWFEGRTIGDLAAMDPAVPQVEGVSGATMTSQAVARGIVLAARDASLPEPTCTLASVRRTWSNVGTVLVTLLGILIGLTSLRGKRMIRRPFQFLLIVYLGFINGDMVSQALLVGWVQNGIPWQTMMGPALLVLAAVSLPVFSGKNVYCHHVCPHGAIQQLLMPRKKRRCVRLGPRWHRMFSLLPGMLLFWVVVVAISGSSFSLVDLEPFDAYLFEVAGWATILVALVGLLVSMFVPMAYCRYGCPTGALLEYLRRHARSDEWQRRDFFAVACLMAALVLTFVP